MNIVDSSVLQQSHLYLQQCTLLIWENYFWLLGPSDLCVGIPPTSVKWELDNDKQNHYRHTISSHHQVFSPGLATTEAQVHTTHSCHILDSALEILIEHLFTDKHESALNMFIQCEIVWVAQDRWAEVCGMWVDGWYWWHKHKQCRARDMQPRDTSRHHTQCTVRYSVSRNYSQHEEAE